MEANHQFKEHGGENFMAIPCLNDDEDWCKTVAKWLNDWSPLTPKGGIVDVEK